MKKSPLDHEAPIGEEKVEYKVVTRLGMRDDDEATINAEIMRQCGTLDARRVARYALEGRDVFKGLPLRLAGIARVMFAADPFELDRFGIKAETSRVYGLAAAAMREIDGSAAEEQRRTLAYANSLYELRVPYLPPAPVPRAANPGHVAPSTVVNLTVNVVRPACDRAHVDDVIESDEFYADLSETKKEPKN